MEQSRKHVPVNLMTVEKIDEGFPLNSEEFPPQAQKAFILFGDPRIRVGVFPRCIRPLSMTAFKERSRPGK